mmetsp:Transcript_206/g.578  ORF Transcript_206/g.578 Transcript_206/m.578 type:complete len:214 (-) Transcript_206:915-1556(-)
MQGDAEGQDAEAAKAAAAAAARCPRRSPCRGCCWRWSLGVFLAWKGTRVSWRTSPPSSAPRSTMPCARSSRALPRHRPRPPRGGALSQGCRRPPAKPRSRRRSRPGCRRRKTKAAGCAPRLCERSLLRQRPATRTTRLYPRCVPSSTPWLGACTARWAVCAPRFATWRGCCARDSAWRSRAGAASKQRQRARMVGVAATLGRSLRAPPRLPMA